eukprot:1764713-Rhodomonas_salina.1
MGCPEAGGRGARLAGGSAAPALARSPALSSVPTPCPPPCPASRPTPRTPRSWRATGSLLSMREAGWGPAHCCGLSQRSGCRRWQGRLQIQPSSIPPPTPPRSQPCPRPRL